MRDLYKILAELEKRQIHFCLQSHGAKAYYNLSFTDPKGKSQVYSSSQMKIIEDALMVVWGHLITNPEPILHTTLPRATNKMPTMPSPM